MVSIIVPVYKVEKYIQRCIDSILHQSYKDIEIILVDDGDSDACGKMYDNFTKMDNRVKVIHKENGGPSSARNAGIEAANGEYLCFVDGDDWIAENYIEFLLSALIDHNADMSACNLIKVTEKNVGEPKKTNNIVIVSKEKYAYALTEDYYAGFAVNKLYKTSIITNNDLYFNEQVFNGEDLLFVIEYLRYCKQVAYINEILYFYYIRPGSMTTTGSFSKRKYTIIFAREKLLEIIKTVAPENTDVVVGGYMEQLIKMKYRLYPEKETYSNVYAEINEKIKRYRSKILWLKGVSLKRRIKLFLMIYCYGVTGILYRRIKGKQ